MSSLSSDEQSPIGEEAAYIYGIDNGDRKGILVSPIEEDEGTPGQPGINHPHQCSICYKVFVSTKGLVQHSIIHTDRKPFSCEICGKPFRFKSNLFEHRSIHSGEQPYVCPYCGKACRLRGNLKKHLKTHIKEPHEIEQAYEAVTGAHASATGFDVSGNAEYIGGESGEEFETPVRAPKRKPVQPKRVHKTAMSMLAKVLRQNGDNLSEGARVYPPLIDMFDSRYTTEEFFEAARAIPFERYDCHSCQTVFVCRYDMVVHCKKVHNIDVNDHAAAPAHWCTICVREFDDQKAYEQHMFWHRRIGALITKGQLSVREPKIRAAGYDTKYFF